jgi:hypothetical protein
MDDSTKENRDAQALMAMIAQSEADIAAGRTRPAREVFAELRAELKAK